MWLFTQDHNVLNEVMQTGYIRPSRKKQTEKREKGQKSVQKPVDKAPENR